MVVSPTANHSGHTKTQVITNSLKLMLTNLYNERRYHAHVATRHEGFGVLTIAP